jgi:hypothetical protein
MCVYVERRSNPSIAEGAIRVYKVIGLDNKSLQRGFQYTADTHYDHPAELTVRGDVNKNVPTDWGVINEGFHAFMSLRIAMHVAEKSGKNGIKCKVVQFTVPDGAEFYKDDHETSAIVTDEIVAGSLEAIEKNSQ